MSTTVSLLLPVDVNLAAFPCALSQRRISSSRAATSAGGNLISTVNIRVNLLSETGTSSRVAGESLAHLPYLEHVMRSKVALYVVMEGCAAVLPQCSRLKSFPALLILRRNNSVTNLVTWRPVKYRVPEKTGGAMMCVQAMRDEAQRCRRLASSIYNPTTTAELEAQADALEERAAQLEAAKHSPQPPERGA